MKISEVLWEAACDLSDGYDDLCCNAIHFLDDSNSTAETFFANLMEPTKEPPSIWFGDSNIEENQFIRFMALLFAREEALRRGL